MGDKYPIINNFFPKKSNPLLTISGAFGRSNAQTFTSHTQQMGVTPQALKCLFNTIQRVKLSTRSPSSFKPQSPPIDQMSKIIPKHKLGRPSSSSTDDSAVESKDTTTSQPLAVSPSSSYPSARKTVSAEKGEGELKLFSPI